MAAKVILSVMLALLEVAFFAGTAPGAEPAFSVSARGAPAGVLASAAGEVELRNENGQWEFVPAGAVVLEGSELRTGEGARAAILFGDATLAILAANTQLGVLEWAPAAEDGVHARLRLARGTVRLLWSRAAEKGEVAVETPVAIIEGGAEEVVVGHDPEKAFTHVACGSGAVRVRGKVGVLGAPLVLISGQATRVEEGQLPQAPVKMTAEASKRLWLETAVVGTGGRDDLAADHVLVTGAQRLPPDLVVEPPVRPRERGAGTQTRFEPLTQQSSPEVRVHDQPLPEFRRLLPGESPEGRVEVEF